MTLGIGFILRVFSNPALPRTFCFVVEPLMTRCAIRKAPVLHTVEAHAAHARDTGLS